jgi:hypothetical protein
LEEGWASLVTVVLWLLVGRHGDRDVGLGFESREILFRAFTGLASAKNVLPEEVPGPHAF